jgi:hypothetical protein
MDDSENAVIERKDQSVAGIPLAGIVELLMDFRDADPQFATMSLGEVVEHHLQQENL